MKQLFLFCSVVLCFAFSQAQVSNNGEVYDKHPGINHANAFTQAYVSGDTTKMRSMVTKNFKVYNMMNTNPKYKGGTIENMIGQSVYLSTNMLNLSIKNRGSAYPDAIDFKRSGLYVYTYEMMTGFDKNNGFKIKSPRNSTFIFNKKGDKIARLLISDNTAHFQKYSESFSTEENGVIYKNHPDIGKIRLVMAHIEMGDVASSRVDFSENARFFDQNIPFGESLSLAENKAVVQSIFDNFELLEINESGYPDLMDYEGSGSVVFSWWDMHFKNKKTKKTFWVDLHLQHWLNDEGKIVREDAYYNGSLFN